MVTALLKHDRVRTVHGECVCVLCGPAVDTVRSFKLFVVFIGTSKSMGVFPQSGLDSGGSRIWRSVNCKSDQEYQNGNICCLNCLAGTRMVSACTTSGRRGVCEECDDGTFTEHTNSLKHCFKCTQCRSDQEIVRACSHTQDTECQCKSGRFCAPDQACEVCKTCLRCKEGEEIVRNCTPTANTECKKIQPKSDPASGASVIVLPVLAAVVVLAVVLGIVGRKWSQRRPASQRNLRDGLKAEQNCRTEEGRNGESGRLSCSSLILPRQLVRARSSTHVEDERKVLCESLNSSASNSQHSLTGPPSYASPTSPPRASPTAPIQPDRREDEQFPKLVPVNGEESLRKCFEYFEEIDVDYHKRFFRHLGILDNVIKSKEHHTYEDKIHDLLNIWVEKEGREASLNDLLAALMDINQRRTAENIMEKAVHYGHYFCEC
ncbi:tumor necrosis factor receptor superfamily member 10B isoform X2 [Larimichthys crocea]|uniref:tumor necrosis factor receptor superfamily member 10B isoform X2 n=1 Tax=Larimichthys crocea TaxID=215358 RepID=UPI0009015809|nr:tumor necrosis factor receptor superfamily member 10B isoform X2 [Larimichthys crocea]